MSRTNKSYTGFSQQYIAYMKSPAWREKSNICIAAANGRCQRCEVAKATQTHHTTYRRLFAELPEDLMAVCSSCHRAIHGKPPKQAAQARKPRGIKGLLRKQHKLHRQLVQEHNQEMKRRNIEEGKARQRKWNRRRDM